MAVYIITTGMDYGITVKGKGVRGTRCPGNTILKSTNDMTTVTSTNGSADAGIAIREHRGQAFFNTRKLSLRLQVTVDDQGEGFAAFLLQIPLGKGAMYCRDYLIPHYS